MKKSMIKIQCKLSIEDTKNADCNDDVTFVRECKSGVVNLEIKVGESPEIPICVNGDNSGILASNPIVID